MLLVANAEFQEQDGCGQISCLESHAAAFWTFWSLSSKYWGQPESIKSYSSLTERDKRAYKGLGCLSGVCGFACVAYVLRHAEIWIQGYTKIFNMTQMGHQHLQCEWQMAKTVDRHSIWKYDHGFHFVI